MDDAKCKTAEDIITAIPQKFFPVRRGKWDVYIKRFPNGDLTLVKVKREKNE